MAEVTGKTTKIISPHLGKYLIYVEGTKAAQNDTITISELSTVDTAILVCGNALETVTISNNVITLTSANTGAVKGLVIGSK